MHHSNYQEEPMSAIATTNSSSKHSAEHTNRYWLFTEMDPIG
jgi:hypothetical protein